MQPDCVDSDALKQFSLFKGLDDQSLMAISRLCFVRTFSPRSLILAEGEPSNDVYFILQGSVKVFLDEQGGKEITMNQLVKGNYFGELGLIRGTPRTASVQALTPTRLAVLPGTDFKRCLLSYPVMASNLIQELAERLYLATESIRRLGLMDVYGRIVVIFNRMAEDVAGQRVIREKLTQQSIASMVGASREMVSRILKDLRRGGYIDIKGGYITILKELPDEW